MAPRAIKSYTDTGCHERLKYFIFFLGNFAVICTVRNEVNCTQKQKDKTKSRTKYEIILSAININTTEQTDD